MKLKETAAVSNNSIKSFGCIYQVWVKYSTVLCFTMCAVPMNMNK